MSSATSASFISLATSSRTVSMGIVRLESNPKTLWRTTLLVRKTSSGQQIVHLVSNLILFVSNLNFLLYAAKPYFLDDKLDFQAEKGGTVRMQCRVGGEVTKIDFYRDDLKQEGVFALLKDPLIGRTHCFHLII